MKIYRIKIFKKNFLKLLFELVDSEDCDVNDDHVKKFKFS